MDDGAIHAASANQAISKATMLFHEVGIRTTMAWFHDCSRSVCMALNGSLCHCQPPD
eukprot:m.17654 g.17654  ORF g.17654 m.17654 type:complete len:57 (+) comp3518_c0_seq2:423-593(+)